MSPTAWLKVTAFAELAGISRQAAHLAVRASLEGRTWQGNPLVVRAIVGRRGGRSGLSYEVALSSLPEALQKAFRDQNADTCAISAHVSSTASASLPAPIAHHVPRIATTEQSRRALAIFKQIEPATYEGLTSKERGAAVQAIVNTTGLPRKTVYNYLQRYRDHGLEGLMRKRPANSGQRRLAVSAKFDQAWRAAGHPPEMLPGLSDYVDLILKGLWKGRAADAGENDIARLASHLLFERCEETGTPMPRNACAIGRRRVRQFRQYKIVNIRDNDAARFRNMLPTIQRDWTGFAPMECVIADVKHLDVLVTRNDGSAAYPKLIGFMDGGTGRVFAYLVLCPERRSISQKLVIEALIAMCQHEHWGFPRQLYLDNGSEFGGLDKIIPAISLLNNDAGREIIRAQPYNSNAKPIEALFARLDRYCFSSLPGYTGPDRTNKKTQNVGRDPVAWTRSWDEFCSTVGGLIDYYHDRPIGGQWGNRSCNQVFQEKVASGWRPTFPRPLALEIAFCQRKTIKLGTRGIRYDSKRWWHPQLGGLAKGIELELLLPWKIDQGPIVLAPDGQAFQLCEDYPFAATDLSGATEAGRRRQGFRRAVAAMDREAPTIDPTVVKLRMANAADRPAIPGRPRFLDQGATIHELAPLDRLIGGEIMPNENQAERKRALERARTERLERSNKYGL